MNSVASIINNVSWAAKPSTFNDPFDCAVSLIPEIDQKAMFELILEEASSNGVEGISNESIAGYKQHFEKGGFDNLSIDVVERDGMCQNLSNRFADLIQDIGVISLSEVDNHILMWSHYADQHKGFCIEYERTESNLLGGNSTLPIRYTDKLPVFSLQSIVKSNPQDRKHYIHSLVLSKALEWAYEREWRYLHTHGNRPVELKANISAIIFGARMPVEQRATLADLVSKYHNSVKLKQVELKKNGFGLEVVDYIPCSNKAASEPKKRKFEHLLDFDL
ncbi:conserved hypothetical protein [Vibrio chagasii]|nr:conserved hypothetical protein [Vibrio chagasii]